MQLLRIEGRQTKLSFSPVAWHRVTIYMAFIQLALNALEGAYIFGALQVAKYCMEPVRLHLPPIVGINWQKIPARGVVLYTMQNGKTSVYWDYSDGGSLGFIDFYGCPLIVYCGLIITLSLWWLRTLPAFSNNATIHMLSSGGDLVFGGILTTFLAFAVLLLGNDLFLHWLPDVLAN